MHRKTLLPFVVFFPLLCVAQGIPELEWQACFGGSGFEFGYSVQQTTDGGYIFAGDTRSNDGQVTGFHGIADAWVVRTDATGTLLWQRALGGSGFDVPLAVVQTMDGGFVVAGSSGSTDGDLAGVASNGRAWVVKLDAGGAIQWQQRYGNSSEDSFWAMEQTASGELLLAGIRNSTTGIPGCNQGGSNAWLVKLDSAGELLWERCYGGSSGEIFQSLNMTDDGGCIAAGRSSSSDGDVSSNNGLEDIWIVKVNEQGDLDWEKSLGGSNTDWAYAVKQTDDGGYVVVGFTYSSNGDVTGHHGQDDVWVVKLSASGALVWQRALGGSNRDSGRDLITHTDGGITVAGWTQSTDGDVSQLAGASDSWLIRLDAEGELLWEKTFGGTGSELFQTMVRTSEGGSVLCGVTTSNDGDVSGNHGGNDIWLVKLGAEPVGVTEITRDPLLSIFPNPTHGTIAVQLSLAEAAPVGLSWFDASGRMLGVERTTHCAPGKLQVTLDIADLPAGLLFLQIVVGEERHMRPVVKM